jgi:hypothetical protein
MSDEPKPKIIVDDDWKSRVQAEKEAARSSQTEAPPQRQKPDTGQPSLPPASLATLISTLATQALAALGHLPRGDKEPPVVQLELAKHFIDTLGVLEHKTKGNLTREEASMLENVLHELRMAFVAASSSR